MNTGKEGNKMKYCDYCEKFVDETFTLEIRHQDDAGRSGMVLSCICMDCIMELKTSDKCNHLYNIIDEYIQERID